MRASEALSGNRPEYRLIDDDELLLTMYIDNKEVQDK